MRIRLLIKSDSEKVDIPISYEYYLSAAIYKWIKDSSREFSKFLHDQGYSPQSALRRFKHFCFSQLFPSDSHVKDERLFIDGSTITWYIGMPVEETLRHFIIGIFERQTFFVGNENKKFSIEQVEIIPEPPLQRKMKFKTISPITVSIPVDDWKNGKITARYLKADDPELTNALRINLLLRYESLYGNKPEDVDFRCTTDAEYIKKRGGTDRVSKLVTIKKGSQEETKVRGFRCPVTLEGSINLIKLAYDSGLGEKGSMGFGMLEVI